MSIQFLSNMIQEMKAYERNAFLYQSIVKVAIKLITVLYSKFQQPGQVLE